MQFFCDAVITFQPLSQKLSVVFFKIGIHTMECRIIYDFLIAGPSNTQKGVFDVVPVQTKGFIINWSISGMTENSVPEKLDASDVSFWRGVWSWRKVITARGRESQT